MEKEHSVALNSAVKDHINVLTVMALGAALCQPQHLLHPPTPGPDVAEM